MTRGQSLLIALDQSVAGLSAPVLTLILLSRGCTLTTLSLTVAVYSAAALALEVPSGVLSDLMGRKRVYLLSRLLAGLSYAILLAAHTLPLLMLSSLLRGIGRAFSSGTIDAALLDEASGGPPEALSSTVSSLLVWQCMGTAGGALLGGILPNPGDYALHPALQLVLVAVTALLACRVLPPEAPRPPRYPSLAGHLRQVRQLLQLPAVLLLLLCTVAGGAQQAAVEIYWQPALLSLPWPGTQALLGLLSALGFAAAILGSWALGRADLSRPRRRWGSYLALLAIRAALTAALALQTGWPGFSGAYLAYYLMLGAFSVPEQVILNAAVPNEARGSMLSFLSLVLQLGCMAGSLSAPLLMGDGSIPRLWLLIALCSALPLALPLIFRSALVSAGEKDGEK